METVRIYPLAGVRPRLQRRLYEAQQEAARVWTVCRDLHLSARQQRTRWPDRDNLQHATKGQFALHSQTVQMVCHAYLANVETTRELRTTNRRIRYPYKDKRFYPLYWPAQAVSVERGRIVLPMGRGRASLVFKLDLPEHIGGCKLVWKDGYELHVSVPAAPAPAAPGAVQAAVDLGEIHQAAVTTNTGAALVVSGRGIRSLKRRHQIALGQLARKRKRCQNRITTLAEATTCSTSGQRAQTKADPCAAAPGNPQGDHLLPAAAGGHPLHRQPPWRTQAQQRTPSQPTNGRVGVRAGHRLPLLQSDSSQHRELHWF